MRIGIDILGGDFAPISIIEGAILASKELAGEVKLVLIGDENIIKEVCAKQHFDSSVFDIVHTTECIGMDEHPAKAFSQKPKSSIAIGFGMLANKQLDGFASAGNTGAMLVAAMYTVKTIPGIIRPVICAAMPNLSGPSGIIMDVGLNPDAKPDVLHQYALIGSLYAKHVNGIDNPRVGLLNIGSEEEKGNLVTKAVYPLLKEDKQINFIGNIEGNEMFHDNKADVLICDGFVGNVVLKEAESFYTITHKLNIQNEVFEKFNYENFGGTPVLGINGVAIIGHGISNAKAIKNMIKQTAHVVKSNLIDRFNEAFNK